MDEETNEPSLRCEVGDHFSGSADCQYGTRKYDCPVPRCALEGSEESLGHVKGSVKIDGHGLPHEAENAGYNGCTNRIDKYEYPSPCPKHTRPGSPGSLEFRTRRGSSVILSPLMTTFGRLALKPQLTEG